MMLRVTSFLLLLLRLLALDVVVKVILFLFVNFLIIQFGGF